MPDSLRAAAHPDQRTLNREEPLYDDPVEALVDVVGIGVDTGTDAVIVGALLGVVHGAAAWPERWVTGVLEREPEGGVPASPIR